MNKNSFVTILLCLLILLGRGVSNPTQAQSSSSSEKKTISVTGTFGTQANLLESSNSTNDAPTPFCWGMFANVTFKIKKISLPFALNYNDNKFSSSKPSVFQRFGISPVYKWITIHAGWRSVGFSPLIIEGTTFLGGGIELKPKYVHLSVVGGRFNKFQSEDTARVKPKNYTIPSFNRFGYAVKLGVGGKENFFDLIFLKIKDDPNSNGKLSNSSNLNPQENVVGGIAMQIKLNKHLKWKTDIATTALSRDLSSDTVHLSDKNFDKALNKAITPRLSTIFQGAAITRLNYNNKTFNWSTEVKYYSPFYRSLGLPSGLADRMEGKSTFGFALFKSKIRISESADAFKNNVMNQKAVTTYQGLNSLVINFNPSSKWGLTLSHNFMMNQQMKLGNNINDSMLQQLTNNGFNITPNVNIINGKISNIIVLAITKQFSKTAGLNALANQSNLTSIVFNNSFTHNKSCLNINVGVLYTLMQSIIAFQTNGFNLGIGKGLSDNKINVNLTSGITKDFFNDVANATSFQNMLSISYNPNKHQSLAGSFGINNVQAAYSTTHIIASLQYTYQF